MRDLLPCGTEAAYQRHIRKGEPVDLACRVAMTKCRRDRYNLRRKRAQVDQTYAIREVIRVLAEALHMYDTGAIRGHTRPETTLYECDTG